MRQSISLYKKNTSSVSPCTYGFRNNSERLEIIKKIIKNQLPDNNNEWDSDEDIPDDLLKSQNKLCIFDPMMQRWVKGVILYNLVGLINVKLENTMDKGTKWYEVQSDFIAPDWAKGNKFNTR